MSHNEDGAEESHSSSDSSSYELFTSPKIGVSARTLKSDNGGSFEVLGELILEHASSSVLCNSASIDLAIASLIV